MPDINYRKISHTPAKYHIVLLQTWLVHWISVRKSYTTKITSVTKFNQGQVTEGGGGVWVSHSPENICSRLSFDERRTEEHIYLWRRFCFTSFALGLAHKKFDVWSWPEILNWNTEDDIAVVDTIDAVFYLFFICFLSHCFISFYFILIKFTYLKQTESPPNQPRKVNYTLW
jgi:hypothetical protein